MANRSIVPVTSRDELARRQSPSGLARLALGLLVLALAGSLPGVAPADSEGSPEELFVTLPVSRLPCWGPGCQVLVSRRRPDGTIADVTRACTLRASGKGIARLDRGGYLSPISPGTIRIVAEHQRRQASATLELVERNRSLPWDFALDVVPVLTRAGCNSGHCHGSASERAGFTLSLFGYDPEYDYRVIYDSWGTKALLNLEQPESSRILLKPTLRLPHRGGRRLNRVTAEHRGYTDYGAIRDWIAAGAPLHGENRTEHLASIAILPGDRILPAPAGQQLAVVAHYSDGRAEDVTRHCRYEVNGPFAEVEDTGLVRLKRGGESVIVVHYAGQVATVRLAAPLNSRLDVDFASLPRATYVDRFVLDGLERLRVPPSPPVDDATWLRRVSLDLIGTLPTPDEVRGFLGSDRPDKRRAWVDRLLGRSEFADYWALRLGDLLRIDSKQLGPGAAVFARWVRDELAAGTGYDRMVRAMLSGRGDRFVNGPANFVMVKAQPDDLAEVVAQTFLGTRIRCARCHNHPLDRWTTDDYWGFTTFFGQVHRTGDHDRMIELSDANPVRHVRTKKPVPPRPLGGAPRRIAEGQDPRAVVAEWLTGPDNRLFAAATANWVWAQLMGRGVVEPVDDFRLSNPPTDPGLLDALADDFRGSGFDLRHLIRSIVLSRTYATSTRTTPENRQDADHYSHAIPRPLPAHVLADAIAQATGVPDEYRVPGTADALAGEPTTLVRAIQANDPQIPSELLDASGRCARAGPCAGSAAWPNTMRQALHLIAGEPVQAKLRAPSGVAARLAGTPGLGAERIVEELYLRTLSRPPTAAETAHWAELIRQSDSRRRAVEDLLWALLNAREFAFNH